jgi:PAS domain S-box-containing protein
MSTDGNILTQQLAEADARIATLHRESTPPGFQPLMPEVFQELQATMEELRVAGEEMHQQNEALAEAQEHIAAERFRYRDLFESAPDSYLVTDMLGVIRDSNRAAQSLLGRGPRSLNGRPLANFIAEEETRAFRQHLLTAGRFTDREEWEFPLRRPSAGVFPATLTVTVIRMPDGEATGLRWLVRDITERAQIEAELRLLNGDLEAALAREHAARQTAEDDKQRQEEQAAFLGALLTASPDGISFLDPDGRYVSINPTLASWNGLSQETYPGRSIEEILPEQWAQIEPYFQRALAGETIHDVDLRGEVFPGAVRPRKTIASYYPVQANGSTLGVGCIFRATPP